jgi:hypothetical protein
VALLPLDRSVDCVVIRSLEIFKETYLSFFSVLEDASLYGASLEKQVAKYTGT